MHEIETVYARLDESLAIREVKMFSFWGFRGNSEFRRDDFDKIGLRALESSTC